MPPPRYTPGAPAKSKMSGGAKAAIIVVLAGLVVIAAVLVVYFTVLNKKSVSGPEATVVKYYEALSSGDMQTLYSLMTPESRPTGLNEQMLNALYGKGSIKFTDLKTSLVSENGSEAQVKITDAQVEVMGQKVKLSQLGSLGGTAMTLKMVNGQWLVVNGAGSVSFPGAPNLPGNSIGI